MVSIEVEAASLETVFGDMAGHKVEPGKPGREPAARALHDYWLAQR